MNGEQNDRALNVKGVRNKGNKKGKKVTCIIQKSNMYHYFSLTFFKALKWIWNKLYVRFVLKLNFLYIYDFPRSKNYWCIKTWILHPKHKGKQPSCIQSKFGFTFDNYPFSSLPLFPLPRNMSLFWWFGIIARFTCEQSLNSGFPGLGVP